MKFEQSGDRLVVRHEARAGFIKLMGWTGAAFLVIGVPMAIVIGIVSPPMPWLELGSALLYGIFGVTLLARAPLRLQLTVDPAQRRISVVRSFSFGRKVNEYAFSDVKEIRTFGASGPNMSVVSCDLRTADGSDVPVLLEGGFAVAQADARALAEKLASAIGVPVTNV